MTFRNFQIKCHVCVNGLLRVTCFIKAPLDGARLIISMLRKITTLYFMTLAKYTVATT